MILKFGSQTVCPIIPNGVGTGTWTLTLSGSGSATAYVLDKAGGDLVGKTITQNGIYTLSVPASGFVPVYVIPEDGYSIAASGLNNNAPFSLDATYRDDGCVFAVSAGDSITLQIEEAMSV